MRRVFDLDVLARAILDHRGLPTEPADPASGPSPSAAARLFPDFPA